MRDRKTRGALALGSWLLLVGAGLAQDADQRTLRLRGSRIRTRDESRQTEIVLEGIDESRRNRSVGDVQLQAPEGREVDAQDLYERQKIVFSGGSVADHAPPRRAGDRGATRREGGAIETEQGASTTTAVGGTVLLLGALIGLILWGRSRRCLARSAEGGA